MLSGETMVSDSNRAGIGAAALVLACCASLAMLPSAWAQEPAADAPGIAAPEAPTEITVADFAIEASAVEERLAQIRGVISVVDVAADVSAELDAIDAHGDELRERFGALESRRMMSSELNTVDAQLELQNARVDRQIDRLSTYANDLAGMERQNEDDIERWTKALRTARRASVPKSVLDRTASILKGLHEGDKELMGRIAEVLELQTRALEVRNEVQLAQQSVVAAQRSQADSLFQRQAAPLWEQAPLPDEAEVREGYDIEFSWPGVQDTLRGARGIWVFQLLLVLALGWLLWRVRALLADRVSNRQQDGPIPWEDQAVDAVRRPWAAALLLGLVSFRLVYPERVVDTIVVTWIVAIPLWFIVFKEMVPRSFRDALIGLGLLGTLHIAATLVSGHPGVERGLLLIELLLAAAGAIWLIRFLQTVDVPKRARQGFWFALTSFSARLALLIALGGAGASLLGYTFLATEAALLVVIVSIAATAYMAFARIVEALAWTAIYTGKLDAFRMIRANRDVTAKTAGRIIRIVASGLFVWGVADMTSVWRPIARVLRRALSTDLGLGLAEAGVSFGDFFAFFIVLWLSWLTARFVSFVLREEVLPRLHMQAGVPFALTTFTRYAIIAIGFVAAVSVLGVPLDRVTIVLSALGVGIGFGLQGLVNNFVSGFVLLTERPIRLRDKVEIEGVLGNVSNIGIRASTIRTFDGAEVIVPNGDLISRRVVNWTLSARRQRVTIPVGVAYGTDPNEVLGILRKVAAAHKGVFKDPPPLALFRGFGESSLDFELRIFMDPSDVLDVPSEVTVGINDALKEAGIEIPFPQRDLYLRGVPEGFAGTDADADAD